MFWGFLLYSITLGLNKHSRKWHRCGAEGSTIMPTQATPATHGIPLISKCRILTSRPVLWIHSPRPLLHWQGVRCADHYNCWQHHCKFFWYMKCGNICPPTHCVSIHSHMDLAQLKEIDNLHVSSNSSRSIETSAVWFVTFAEVHFRWVKREDPPAPETAQHRMNITLHRKLLRADRTLILEFHCFILGASRKFSDRKQSGRGPVFATSRLCCLWPFTVHAAVPKSDVVWFHLEKPNFSAS